MFQQKPKNIPEFEKIPKKKETLEAPYFIKMFSYLVCYVSLMNYREMKFSAGKTTELVRRCSSK